MYENTNLPISVNNKLQNRIKNKIPRLKEISKKIGKCILYGGISFAGLGVAVIGGPALMPLGFASLGIGIAREYQNLLYRNQSDLMFSTRKILHKNSTLISQDPFRFDIMGKMKDFSAIEKGSLMALQTLIGLQRYKKQLENKIKEPSDMPGINIYSKKFHTQTHGINIKNMKALEKLGYIKIDNNLENSESKRKLILFERLGFGETKAVKNIVKAALKGDKKFLESSKKEIQTVEFRLTDKPINFEELYELCNNRQEDNQLRTPARRLATIFDKNYGLLKTQSIDIQMDSYGMPTIVYNAKKSFANEMENNKVKSKKPSIRDTLKYIPQNENQLENENTKEQIRRMQGNKENENDLGNGERI